MPPWQHGKIGSGWRSHGTRGKQIIATEHAQCNSVIAVLGNLAKISMQNFTLKMILCMC